MSMSIRLTADDYADLARLAEAATRGPWLASPYGIDRADVPEVGAEALSRADAEFIAAANPATILRLIAALDEEGTENMNRRDALSFLKEERDALAAKLAAVEALADDQARPFPDGAPDREGEAIAREIRAALAAAPINTTKET